MAEWLVERGIGEDRALLLEGDRVCAAKLAMHGEVRAGMVLDGRLVARAGGSARGTVLTDAGLEVLVDKLPREISEGSPVAVELTRAPIAEHGRAKRAQGRLADNQTASQDPANDIFATAREVRRFPPGTWEEVWNAASAGVIEFNGGKLVFAVTPAMVLIDIDGDTDPRTLALAAVPAIAGALHWYDLGGSIGIDFPTLAAKADRKAVDTALADALADWPHERTAMNGFGFVQLVARLDGPSLLHRFTTSRSDLCARMALRRAEMVEGAGALLLTVHPIIKPRLRPQWLAELARRTGREVRIGLDPALALEASQAQIVSV